MNVDSIIKNFNDGTVLVKFDDHSTAIIPLEEAETLLKTIWCTICGAKFSEHDIEIAMCCPECHTRSIPCHVKEDVSVKINWHELRVLTIWAENWARHCVDKDLDAQKQPHNMMFSLMCICERLQKQFPDRTPLTLFSEVRELRNDYKIDSDLDDDKLLEK